MVVDIQWYAHKAGSMREKFQYIPFGGVEMDQFSRLLPDPERFPSSAGGKGFGPLAEYIHSLGLKFGIHIMRGIPRAAAHSHSPIKGSGLTADMVADPSSICRWNPDMYGVRNSEAGQAWHYKTYANMWRITGDFLDEWKQLKAMFYRCELWQYHVEAGCYPDCDMLPLGQLGGGFQGERACRFTAEEQRTMMTLWCLFGSPLMLGAELTRLDDWTLSLLTNRDILAMLTPDCRPRQIRRNGAKAVWAAENGKSGECAYFISHSIK